MASMTSSGWRALGATLVGTFFVTLSQSLLFSVTPKIMVDLGAGVTDVAWLSISYALSMSALQPITGKIADLYGRKLVFLGGVALFTLGAALASISWDVFSIAASRFIQGAGAAAVFPVGVALIGEYFPEHERGKVVGVWGISAGSSMSIGPMIGGWILDLFGWRAIFHFSIIVGILSIIPPLLMLRSSTPKRTGGLDFGGSIGVLITVGPLLLAVSQGGVWGWTSAPVLALIATFLIGLTVSIVLERRSKEPVIDPLLVTSPLFLATTAAAFLAPMAYYGLLFLAPFFLMDVHHYTGGQVGLLLTVFFIPSAITAPTGGFLSDRVQPGILVVWGTVLALLGGVPFIFVDADTPLWHIAGALALSGAGVGLTLPPLMKIVLSVAPQPRMASVTGTFNMLRVLGGPVGVTLISSVFATRAAVRGEGVVASYGDAFAVTVGICFVGVLTALLASRAYSQHAALVQRLRRGGGGDAISAADG